MDLKANSVQIKFICLKNSTFNRCLYFLTCLYLILFIKQNLIYLFFWFDLKRSKRYKICTDHVLEHVQIIENLFNRYHKLKSDYICIHIYTECIRINFRFLLYQNSKFEFEFLEHSHTVYQFKLNNFCLFIV